MSQTADDTSAPMTEGVRVRTSFDTENFPLRVVVFDIESEREDAATVTLQATVSDTIDIADIGFHPNYGEEHWTTRGRDITFEYDLAAGEEVRTICAYRGDQPLSDLLENPTITVDPPLAAETEEDETGAEEADTGFAEEDADTEEAESDEAEPDTEETTAEAETDTEEAVAVQSLDGDEMAEELAAALEDGPVPAATRDTLRTALRAEDRAAAEERDEHIADLRSDLEEVTEAVESLGDDIEELQAELDEAASAEDIEAVEERLQGEIEDLKSQFGEIAAVGERLASAFPSDG
jgi:hypothetical protein